MSVKRLSTFGLFLVFNCVAEEKPSSSVYAMTLSELLSVNVSVASTDSENLINTPAIVSRYERSDLEQMGITSLREMFNFVPGVVVQDSMIGFASVQIRGIDETFNQKVLFLLDGVPYHQPSHSMIPMEGVPWEAISHIEVIRGPGAVFYGTQASGGVFNVITRKDTEKRSAYAKVGKSGLKEGSIYYNKQLSEESAIFVSAEYRTQDGYSTTYSEPFPDVGIVSDDVTRYLNRESALLRYSRKDLTLQFQTFLDTTVGINDAYTDINTLQPIVLDTRGRMLHAENRWGIENGRVRAFADYNFYTLDFRINNLFAPGVDALITKDNNGEDDYRFRYGADLTYSLNPAMEIVAGLEQERRSVGTYRIYANANPQTALVTVMPKGSVAEFSAFTQLDYSKDDWRVLIGARYTDNEKSGGKVTPRAALVYNIDANQSIKLLYSTGFNSPNPTQTDIYAAGNLIGNQSLSAEVVKTFDVAYSYSKANTLFVINVYKLDAEDFILRRFEPSLGAVSFYNEAGFGRTGAEIDLQMATEKSTRFINLAYQKEGNREVMDDPGAFNTPKFTFSAGFSYSLGGDQDIGADISYIGERNEIDSYSLLNATYTKKFKQFDVFFNARNILDEVIMNPNNSNYTLDLVSYDGLGRNFELGVRVHF